MGQNNRDNSRWREEALLTVVAAGVALCGMRALGQQHNSGTAGHISAPATGHFSGGRTMGTRPMAPGQSAARAIGNGATHGGGHGSQRFGARANSLNAGSAPPPSWELPRTVTPHWEIAPNIPIQPNAVQGNPIPRQSNGLGVGYAGLPYYVNPMAFGNADDDTVQQQAQPGNPARPEYAPQAPYEGGLESSYAERGSAPPPRAPYAPQAYPLQQSSRAARNAALPEPAPENGLDHPAVTLLFQDGRPPMQVHSYVLTSTSVLVAEKGHQRVIPITDLDLPATIAQNREAGVDFELPGGSR